MADVFGLLAALQHGDSQFPSGGFAFSWGLEGLLADGLMAREDLAGFIEGQFCHRWGGFERVVIAQAHGLAGDLLDWPSWTTGPMLRRSRLRHGRAPGVRATRCWACMCGSGQQGRRNFARMFLLGKPMGTPRSCRGWCWRAWACR